MSTSYPFQEMPPKGQPSATSSVGLYQPESSAGPIRQGNSNSFGGNDPYSQNERILDQGFESVPAPLYPTPSGHPRLPVPIAIPQIGIGSRMDVPLPITRAYPPMLSDFGVSKQEFLKMVDMINICLSEPAPFQAMEIASMGIGFVPEPIAMGLSTGLDVIAGAGTAATCYFRTLKYIKTMNKEIWEPRGLKVDMVKDVKVLETLGLTEERVFSAMMQTPNSTSEPQQLQQLEALPRRRLRALGPRVAALDYDVPPPNNPKNVLDKLSAKQQARKAEKKANKIAKRQLKREKRRAKYEEELGTSSKWQIAQTDLDYYYDSDASTESSASDSSILSLSKRLSKADSKVQKINEKADSKLVDASEQKVSEIEKERAKKLEELEKEMQSDQKRLDSKREAKLAKRMERQKEKEEHVTKKIRKLEWFLVTNAS